MPKAYSYARFSSAGQKDGNSIDRQLKIATEYHSRNLSHLPLDTSRADEGFSAYKGQQISKGSLGHFLAEIKAGTVEKGSALIVENLDRISRQGPKFARKLIEKVVDNGVEMHIVNIAKVLTYGWEDRIQDSVVVDCELTRAYKESESRSIRIGAAWAAKKRNGTPGISITARSPGWLEGRTGEKIRVNEKKAKIVRDIFDWTTKGMGARLIARRFDEAGVHSFIGNRWTHSSIRNILNNRAVLGEYQPMKGKEKDGNARRDFFPRIIEQEVWDKAQAAKKFRNTGSAGRVGKLYNLFSRLVFDSNLGLPMHYCNKSGRNKPVLITDSKERKGSVKPNHVGYEKFETAFLNWLDQLDWTNILDVTDRGELQTGEAKIALLNREIEDGEARIQKAIDLLLELPSAKLKERLQKLEAELAENKILRDAEIAALEDSKRKHRDFLNKEIVYATLSAAKDLETRSRLRQEIRRKVARIEVSFCEAGDMYGSGPKFTLTQARVFFANGVERQIGIWGDSWIATMQPFPA